MSIIEETLRRLAQEQSRGSPDGGHHRLAESTTAERLATSATAASATPLYQGRSRRRQQRMVRRVTFTLLLMLGAGAYWAGLQSDVWPEPRIFGWRQDNETTASNARQGAVSEPSTTTAHTPALETDALNAATPSPAVSNTSAALPEDQATIERSLQAWAAAWSRQDTDAYLGHYAKSFVPEETMKRSQWESKRRQRLRSQRAVQVSITLLATRHSIDGTVWVRLRQDYRSQSLQEIGTLKQLQMVRVEGDWKIQREQVVNPGQGGRQAG